MKNSNYSESWVDIAVPGNDKSFVVQRYYNSRSVFNGLFGLRWCSDFETTARVTPEGAVLLVECGAGQETLYVTGDYESHRDEVIKSILAGARAQVGEDKLALFETQLRENVSLRMRWARSLGVATPPATGELLSPKTPGLVARRTSGGVELFSEGKRTQSFDTNGLLVEDSLGEGRVRRILRDGEGNLQAVWSEDGQVFRVSLTEDKKRIASISTLFGRPARYSYEGDELVSATNMWGNTYSYGYDADRNLVRVGFPDGTFKALTYNNDRSWVLSFVDRAVAGVACREDYQYEMDPVDPTAHFWSTATKTCAGVEKNRARFEFWFSTMPNGDSYMSRVRTVSVTGILDVSYTPLTQPSVIERDHEFVAYFYNGSGLLRGWRLTPASGPLPTQTSVEYQDPCGLPALIRVDGPGGSTMVHYTYDQTCQLLSATGSNGASFTVAPNGSAVFTRGPDDGRKAIASLPELVPNEVGDRLDPFGRLCKDWNKFKASSDNHPNWRHC